MERFLQIITIVCIFLIGSGLFSFLYALGRRIAQKILIRQEQEEAEEEAAKMPSENPTSDKALAGEPAKAEQSDQNGISTDVAVKKEEGEQKDVDTVTEEDAGGPEHSLRSAQPLGKDYICESCGVVLKPWEILPILSFLLQRGKCSWCGAKIPIGEFLSELLGGCLFEALFFRFGRDVVIATIPKLYGVLDITAAFRINKIPALLLLIFVCCLLFLIGVVDQESMEIPNALSLCMLAAGIGAIFLFPEITLTERLIGFFCISVPLLVITLIIPGAFGGGDIKLMAGAGLLLGWKLILVAFFIGILTGGIYAIVMLVAKKIGRKGHFAFGPYLCVGIGISLFFGSMLLSAYLSLGRRLYGM